MPPRCAAPNPNGGSCSVVLPACLRSVSLCAMVFSGGKTMAHKLTDRKQAGKTTLQLPPFGFGAAHLGGMYSRPSGEVARATLQAAWDGGVRFYDTAPYYGHGLSEHR